MRTLMSLSAGLLSGLGVFTYYSLCDGGDGALRGHYVEARTASVFAGACHYNGEYTTQGREAVLAWSFDGGEFAGVPLAGLGAVAVVAADANLKEPGAERRSTVYLDRDLSEDQRGALERLVRERWGAALGEIRSVELAEVSVENDGRRFAVAVDERIALSGEALPDRACCSMPQNVWYEPLVGIEERVVARTDVFRSADRAAGEVWSRSGENDAFVGSFRVRSCCVDTGCDVERAPHCEASVAP
jgi:hypothetical protein